MMEASLARYIDAVGSASSLEEASRWIVDIGERIGLDRPGFIEDFTGEFARAKHYGGFFGEGSGWLPVPPMGEMAQPAHKICPIVKACRGSVDPFAWLVSDYLKSSAGAESCTQAFWRRAAAQGITGGVTVPVHMPMSRVGAVGWLATRPQVDFASILADYSHELRLAAHLFMAQAYRQRGDLKRTAELDTLTDRELECLTWVARGKTDSEIGEIIGRSVYTARFHVESAAGKLGANNRARAVAVACQMGLISALA